MRRCDEQQADERERPALEREHGRIGEGAVLVSLPGGHRQEGQSGCTQAESDQVAPTHSDPEPAARRNGQQRQPACDHGLHERERGHREGNHVHPPAERGEAKSDHPPARSKESGRAAQRTPHRDIGRGDGAAVLAEHRHPREGGASQCQYQSEFAH